MAIISNGTSVASGGNLQAPRLTGNLPALNASSLTDVPAGVSNVNTVIITSSSTYTPTSGTKFFRVYCTGGGGGSGGIYPQNQNHYAQGGSGAGGTAIRVYDATEMGATASVTIGSGGSGANYDGQTGGTGGTSSFDPAGTGTTISGSGGEGSRGLSGSQNGIIPSGDGGSGSGGEINIRGESGTLGNIAFNLLKYGPNSQLTESGAGGKSFWGNAGRPRKVTSSYATSEVGTWGAGASGFACYSYQSNFNGQTGSSGVVVIEEYA